jgi:hypothetical protein
MPQIDPDYWLAQLRHTLTQYDESLLRQVAAKLIKPRGQWPPEVLIERLLEAIDNVALLDRRLKELPEASRKILTLIGLSRQPRWYLGNLVEMAVALGHEEGLEEVGNLLEAGFLFPDFSIWVPLDTSDPAAKGRHRCRSFTSWMCQAAGPNLYVFAHPSVTGRLRQEAFDIPDWPVVDEAAATEEEHTAHHEADGLEWFLRLTILWQQVKLVPLRLTQQGDFFKRDLDRLTKETILAGQPADSLTPITDIGPFTVALALAEGLLEKRDGELHAAGWPAAWDEGLPAAVHSLWTALPNLAKWNPVKGWCSEEQMGNPYRSMQMLAMLLLTRRGEAWTPLVQVIRWLVDHHPYWRSQRSQSDATLLHQDPTGGTIFLLGIAYQMQLVQVRKQSDQSYQVRLTRLGRWLLESGKPPVVPGFPKTMLVQPNLEVLLYRQGLTPQLAKQIGRLAAWKNLGAVCSLQLQPETVYLALEQGETFASLLQILDRHGMKPTPTPVVESLRTWAQKRERISVYPSAIVLEFSTEEDLQEALRRGVPMTRVSDTLAIITREEDIDYKHFRIAGSRDYTLPPEQCVAVGPDGVSLEVDLTHSDLLLEIEIQRFAQTAPAADNGNRRVYRLTPESLQAACNQGLTLEALETWFLHRCGEPLPASVRLILTGKDFSPFPLRRRVVVQVPEEEIADGLEQWPETRDCIDERLGPTALAVREEMIETLRERLRELGVEVNLP